MYQPSSAVESAVDEFGETLKIRRTQFGAMGASVHRMGADVWLVGRAQYRWRRAEMVRIDDALDTG